MQDDAPPLEPKETSLPPQTFKLLRKLFYTFVALIVVVVVFGQVLPRLALDMRRAPSKPEMPAVDETAQRFERIEQGLKALEEKASAPLPVAQDTMLAEKIAALEAKLQTLEQQKSAGDAQDERLSAMETRLAESEKTIQSLSTQLEHSQAAQAKHMQRALAFTQLKEALLSGKPFGAEMKKLELLSDSPSARAALEKLAAYADKPVSLAQLQHMFSGAIDGYVKGKNGGDTLVGNVRSLVRIRKVGTPQGTDNDAIVARAETLLQSGNVTGAKAELMTLSPDAAARFDEWLKQAAYYEAPRALLLELEPLLVADNPAP